MSNQRFPTTEEEAKRLIHTLEAEQQTIFREMDGAKRRAEDVNRRLVAARTLLKTLRQRGSSSPAWMR